jgi:hypothetical protein
LEKEHWKEQELNDERRIAEKQERAKKEAQIALERKDKQDRERRETYMASKMQRKSQINR